VETRIPIEPARWRRSQIAETFASVRVSAPCYRFAEYVGFFPVVESELKLREVQRQIFSADMMVRAEYATLQKRPEGFHRVRVNDPAHVFALAMIHGVVRELLPACEVLITGVFIGCDQRDFLVVYYFVDEPMQRRHVGVFDHLADHVSFSADRANDGNFTASPANMLFLVGVTIFVESAHVSFIDFNDAHEFAEVRVFHSGAQSHAHVPRGLIRAGSKHPMNLECADSFLRRDHQVQNFEPCQQRLFRFLENRSGREREPIRRARLRSALHALPANRTGLAFVYVLVAATRATNAQGPAAREQIVAASFLIRKHPLEVANRHLPNEAGFCIFAHVRYISSEHAVSQEPDNRLPKEAKPTAGFTFSNA
jgi:hypothetical protein